MTWIIGIVAVAAFILSIYLLDKKPNLSLAIAIVVPFVCFYFIGKLDGEVVFIFFAGIFVVVMNFLNRTEMEDS
ncbi:hypothetical protein [Virgibacillus doumboii]|uniref:hypothetical protein n=1 Tax=Virgibacillus doumboii TaxID=2697503 RepID=UPI0013E08B1F|nr:hypothetical protein [Virgibacillus doumboii]